VSYLKQIKITKMEERLNDVWYDMNLRQLRNGAVHYYRVRDFLTGDWLFKLCRDRELGKLLVKAVKCPSGARFAQLEGNTMVFQPSQNENWLYDIISLTQADQNDKLSRKAADTLEEVPLIIKENYDIKPYQEVKGKTAPGKHWVTLSRTDDEKGMITLFLLERAWTLSSITPGEKLKKLKQQERQELKREEKEIDTGQTWECPICGEEYRLKHIEAETITKHMLKKH
jgi:hypothetical protein